MNMDYMPTVGAVLGSLSAAGFARFFFQSFIQDTKSSLKELSRSFQNFEKGTARDLAEVKTELNHCIKDLVRLEALIGSNNKNVENNALRFSELSSSIRALWQVLHRLFPDKIPKRIIDEESV